MSVLDALSDERIPEYKGLVETEREAVRETLRHALDNGVPKRMRRRMPRSCSTAPTFGSIFSPRSRASRIACLRSSRAQIKNTPLSPE